MSNDINKDGINDDTDGTVAYLCFWENGTNISWSVPELYRYNIYLQTYPGQDTTGLTTITKSDGKTYYLADFYDTCDDSEVSKQTQPGLTGFESVTYPYDRSGYQFSTFEYQTLTGTTNATLLAQPGSGYFDSNVYKYGFEVHFYYTRNQYTLDFSNYNAESDTFVNTNKMYYGQKLSAADGLPADDLTYTPPYPKGLEPGAYEFGGWFDSPEWSSETAVDWTNDTMSDGDLTVYAKWTPVTHNVYFYYDYADYVAAQNAATDADKEQYYWYHMENGVKVPSSYPIETVHGKLVGTPYSNTPEAQEGYSFVGWFYMDEDNKKRFAPDSMEVKRDLHLFAEWQSGFDTTYEVTYVLNSDPTVKIADAVAGHLTAGKTKTFNAKVGVELLPEYQTKNLFPTVNSHSILMDQDKTKNNFQFRYVEDDQVWYRVRYVDKITGLDLVDEKVETSTKAIVTEKFVPVPGYIPANYYIRKVLASDGPGGTVDDITEYNNEIIFYYNPDTTHGLYTIEYYTQNLNGDWYLEQSALGSADLDQTITVTVEPNKFTGFAYKETVVTTYEKTGDTYVSTDTTTTAQTVTGKVAANGLEIRIYYTRIPYDYTVQYVEYGTTNVLYSQTDKAAFGAEVSHTAPATFNHGGMLYLFYETTEKKQSQEMTIRASNTENVMTFYYAQKQFEIRYHAICTVDAATGFGAVSINAEKVTSASNLSGSTAMAGDGFKFAGWYSGEVDTEGKLIAGTLTPVDAGWIAAPNADGDVRMKPGTLDTNKDTVHYFARFEPVQENLTISKQAADGTTLDANDGFLFRITGTDVLGNKVDLTVTIQGAGSVTIKDLYCGDYTVKELTDWSWTYTNTDGNERSVTLTTKDAVEGYTVTFTNAPKTVDWLHGEAEAKENQFKIN